MKTLTNKEKALLKQVVTELKAMVDPDSDYEGISVEAMLDGYLDAKCNPKASIEIKEKTIYRCGTPEDAVAFLRECASQGIILLTDGGSMTSVIKAVNSFDGTIVEEPLNSAEFMLTPSGDKVRMGANLSNKAEGLAVFEFKASKGAQ